MAETNDKQAIAAAGAASQAPLHIGIDVGSTTVKVAVLDDNNEILYSCYRRHHADIRATIVEVVGEAAEQYPATPMTIAITGSGGLLLAQWLGIFFNTVYVSVAHKCDACAAAGDAKAFNRTVWGALILKAGAVALLAFLCSFALQAPLQAFVNSLPVWLVDGFEVAGGILPAVGLGLLLMVMLKSSNIAYLFLGFIMATFMNLPNVLPIAIAAVCLAYINFVHEKKGDDAIALATSSHSDTDGSDDDDDI